MIRRRDFIAGLGTAAGWPLAARAQQAAMPIIGLMNALAPDTVASLLAAFRDGLKEAGFTEGQNVAIEYRFAQGNYDRLQGFAVELVRRPVNLLVATGGSVSALAAKAATSTIPIVFNVGDDPVKLGLVASLNRPGGNITGVNVLSSSMEPKRLGLLRELVPHAAVVAALLNPDSPDVDLRAQDIQAAAAALGWKSHIFRVSRESELEPAFALAVREHADALLVSNDPFLNNSRERIVALASRNAIPAMYAIRAFAAAGGLICYGIDLTEVYRMVGGYAGRILKGTKPADLPVLQPTKFELVINLKTSKALGVNISDNLLSLADEVIE